MLTHLLVCTGASLLSIAIPSEPSAVLAGADFHHATSSNSIREFRPPLDQLGGTLHVHLKNHGDAPLVREHVKSLQLNAVPLDALGANRGINWFRLLPPEIPPGESGLLSINASAPLFAAGNSLILRFDPSSPELKLTIPPRPDPAPRLAFARCEAARILLFVRNDDPAHDWLLDPPTLIGPSQLKIQSARWLGSHQVPPHQLAVGEILLDQPPDPGRHLILSVTARTGQEGESPAPPLTRLAPVRPMTLPFPVGTWQGEAWDDTDRLADLARRGLNANVFGAPGTDQESRVFDQLAPQHHFRCLTFQGYPEIQLEFLKRRQNDPAFLAAMVMDEPDWKPDPRPGEGPRYVTSLAAAIDQIRMAAPAAPIYLNLARSRRFGEFAPLADIASMDAYRVGAPAPDRWPQPWGGLLESVADYTRDIKRNAEPAPAWVWAQGCHPWDERIWVNDQLGRAMPTPDEMESQLLYQLGAGAKGVFWFTTATPREGRKFYAELASKNPRFKNLPEADLNALLDRIEAQFTEALDSIARLSRLLNSLGPILVRSEPGAYARILRAPRPEKLTPATLAGPESLLLVLSNADYTMKPSGYEFHAHQNVQVQMNFPPWLQPTSAAEITPDGSTLLPAPTPGQPYQLTLESVRVGRVVLFTAPESP